VHPILMQTTGFEGYFEAEVEGGAVRLATPTHIQLPVALLKSNNAMVDGELQKRLEARKFPYIEGDLKQVDSSEPNKSVLTGELSLHGVRQSLQVTVLLRASADGSMFEIAGEKVIDMRDFGLEPPKFLFFKVDPRVRIQAWLVARKQA
jgi:polyisoprenoid-binding protein YceI